jgi:predicted transcriptional regulator
MSATKTTSKPSRKGLVQGTPTVGARLRPSTKSDLDRIARKHGVSRAEMIRRAIHNELERQRS